MILCPVVSRQEIIAKSAESLHLNTLMEVFPKQTLLWISAIYDIDVIT